MDYYSVAKCKKAIIKHIKAIESEGDKANSPVSIALNIQSIRSNNPQANIFTLRPSTYMITDSILVAEKKWEHQRRSEFPDFDSAVYILLSLGDYALDLWREAADIFGEDSEFARELTEVAGLLEETSKKRDTLSFDTVADFWNAGDQAISMLTGILKKIDDEPTMPVLSSEL